MVEYCSGSDWVTSRTFAWWWTLWYGDLLNLPTVVGEKKNQKNKQTSIWRSSSQTAGCIKGPVCLFYMDPVTFTHPRAGRARTNSVTALERCVQRREKKSGVFTRGGDVTCIISYTLCKKKKLLFLFLWWNKHTQHFVGWARIGWASHQWGEGGVRMNCARDASCFGPTSLNIALFLFPVL